MSPLRLFVEQNWPILLAAAAGLLAIYLLLPRARRYPGTLGALAGALTLVLVGLWLVRPERIWVESLLFYVFAGLAVLFGGLMITQTQPVRAALSFAMVVLSTCGLFLLQAAPFLMAATIIIYAGAIVVTFLFVIMLAQQSGLDNADHRSREPFLSCVAGFVLLAAILCVLQRDYRAAPRYAEALPRVNEHLEEPRKSRPDVEPVADAAALEAQVNDYVNRLGKAAHAPDAARVLAELGEGKFVRDFMLLVKPLEERKDPQNYKKKLYDDLNDLSEKLVDPADDGAKDAPADLPELVREAYALGWRLKNELDGTPIAMPAAALPLSSFSGARPNEPPPLDRLGNVAMPADNVGALGLSLFTDYLVGVELAATLLLVATIGAIVIAARRTEVLR